MLTLVVVGGVVFVLAVWQRRACLDVLTAIGGQISKIGRAAKNIDPVANYQAEVDRSADEINDLTSSLAEFKGIVERYKRKVETGQKQEANLTALVKSAIASNDDAKATNHLLKLQDVQKQLTEDIKHRDEYEQTYQNNLKKVKYARERVEAVKEKARNLASKLNFSAVEANVTKLAGKLNLKSNSFDALNQIEEEIQSRIDTNQAQAQVARDLSADGLDEIEEQENQKKAIASELLNKFKTDLAANK